MQAGALIGLIVTDFVARRPTEYYLSCYEAASLWQVICTVTAFFAQKTEYMIGNLCCLVAYLESQPLQYGRYKLAGNLRECHKLSGSFTSTASSSRVSESSGA